MAITTVWSVLQHQEEDVHFKLLNGSKGYVLNGIEQLLFPYSADGLRDQIIRVPLLHATINTIEEKAHEGGERLTSKNWFGFNIVDGIMNIVTWYETPGSLVRYGMLYTSNEVVPQFPSMLREPEKPFEWENPVCAPRRLSRYERGWVI